MDLVVLLPSSSSWPCSNGQGHGGRQACSTGAWLILFCQGQSSCWLLWAQWEQLGRIVLEENFKGCLSPSNFGYKKKERIERNLTNKHSWTRWSDLCWTGSVCLVWWNLGFPGHSLLQLWTGTSDQVGCQRPSGPVVWSGREHKTHPN